MKVSGATSTSMAPRRLETKKSGLFTSRQIPYPHTGNEPSQLPFVQAISSHHPFRMENFVHLLPYMKKE